MGARDINRDLWHLCQAGHLEGVHRLVLHGASANWQNPTMAGSTGFLEACREGREDVVRYLLLEWPQLDPNLPNQFGITPLYAACAARKAEIVGILLADPRVDASRPDISGWTPLYACCAFGRLDMACLLLQSRKHLDELRLVKASRTTCLDLLRTQDHPASAAVLSLVLHRLRSFAA